MYALRFRCINMASHVTVFGFFFSVFCFCREKRWEEKRSWRLGRFCYHGMEREQSVCPNTAPLILCLYCYFFVSLSFCVDKVFYTHNPPPPLGSFSNMYVWRMILFILFLALYVYAFINQVMYVWMMWCYVLRILLWKKKLTVDLCYTCIGLDCML